MSSFSDSIFKYFIETMKTQPTATTAVAATPTPPSPVDRPPVQVVKEGTKLIIPTDMTYADARSWLTRQEEAEEKAVSVFFEIISFPLDAIVALMKALRERYQFTELRDTPSFFGSQPPTLIQVDLGNGQFETAPLGRFAPPMFEGGYLETVIDPRVGMKLIICGTVKRKFEPEIKAVIKRAQEFLSTGSIYKGRAILIDLEWMEGNRAIDLINDAPKFWDVAMVDETQLILNPSVEFDLITNIWTLIERPDACRANHIPIRHGCLLGGKFGTGKTLTARVTAAKAVRHGFTFIYLKNSAHLAQALKLAELYLPAVVFAEDIDLSVSGERDAEMNAILNTMDGVDTKNIEIITVLTTNHLEEVAQAFLRAGRIDTVIPYTLPEAKTAERFVRFYSTDEDKQSLLAPDVDLTRAGEILNGMIPAFIAEAVQKAKRRAIHRTGEADIKGFVTAEDIELAAQSLQAHIALVNGVKAENENDRIAGAVRTLINTNTCHAKAPF